MYVVLAHNVDWVWQLILCWVMLLIFLIGVQELMWRGSDPLVVLRLLVLLSYVGNGLPKKHAGKDLNPAGA
jgi:hypothetical protein